MDRFARILVACPAQGVSQDLMGRVRSLAQASGAAVTLVMALASPPGELARLVSHLTGGRGPEVEQGVLDRHRSDLDRWAEPLRAAGIPVECAVEQGTPSIRLVRRVLRDGHDILIKDAEHEDGWPFLRGLDMQLLRLCPCPVWILNAPGEPTSARILAAVDTASGDPAHDRLNHEVMRLAVTLARREAAHLDVVSVWSVPEESTLRGAFIGLPDREVDAIVAEEESRSARRLRSLVEAFPPGAVEGMRVLHLKGRPAPAILRHVEAERIDTVVMGTVARTGVAGFLIGNTAETILARVACSVLAVKPEGFVGPVEAGLAPRAESAGGALA